MFWYTASRLFLLVLLLIRYNAYCREPLHIFFIVGHFPAPSQTFILNQITGLIDRGHKVSIFSFNKDNALEYVHPDVEKYKLLDHVIYEDFPEELPDCNIVFCQFGYHGKKIFEIPEIADWLKTKKVVTCLRGSDITTRILKKPHKYAQLFELGDLFLPVCDYFRQLLINGGFESEKVVVHYSAIDCSQFFFKRRQLPSRGPVKLISVCRLVEKKGIRYAISAVAKLIHKYPNVLYYIVGDGPEKPYLASLIRRLKMQDHIILCGWKSQKDVVNLLNQSHIFLLPSVTGLDGNEEGIPNALKEAMAMGLPVIATWHAGNSELIEDSVSGFLVPQKNVHELYKKIMYVIKHPAVWSSIGTAGRKVVEEKFETKKVVVTLEKIFYQLLEQ